MGQFKPKRLQDQRVCGHCGAANDADTRECWLCERPIWSRMTPEPSRWADSIPEPPPVGCFVALSVTTLAVALFAVAPGLGILLIVTAVPALLVTEFHARRRLRRGRPMYGFERIGWTLLWMVFLPILLSLALFIAVLVLCGVGGAFR